MGLGIVISVIALTSMGTQGSEVLYTPVREIKDQNISVKGWGSGVISETDEVAYEGTRSIRISTRNFFQGGQINFGSPVDLAKAQTNKNNLFRLIYRPVDSGAMGTGAGGANRPGSGTGGSRPGGGVPGGGFPGGGVPGGGQFGGGGAPGGFGGAAAGAAPSFKMIRVIITTTDGKKSEAYIPTNTSSSAGERGWRTVSVPLQAISGFDRTNKVINQIGLSADTTTTFYVGDLRVVSDSTPIRAEITPKSFNRELGAEMIFGARGEGGSSILKYTWDFDDTDGSDENVDSEGQYVKRKFRKAGSYTITLTVSDYFGLKEKYKTSIKGVING